MSNYTILNTHETTFLERFRLIKDELTTRDYVLGVRLNEAADPLEVEIEVDLKETAIYLDRSQYKIDPLTIHIAFWVPREWAYRCGRSVAKPVVNRNYMPLSFSCWYTDQTCDRAVNEERPHPHIHGENDICLYQWFNPLSNLLVTGQLLAFFDSFWLFLHAYDDMPEGHRGKTRRTNWYIDDFLSGNPEKLIPKDKRMKTQKVHEARPLLRDNNGRFIRAEVKV